MKLFCWKKYRRNFALKISRRESKIIGVRSIVIIDISEQGGDYMKTYHFVALTLLIIGGLNWLLLGLFQWEIGAIFGGSSALISRLIYILVGLSAIYEIATHKQNCKLCGVNSGSSTGGTM